MKKIVLLLFVLHIADVCFAQNGKIISEQNGVTVLKVWGTHAERGYAQGYFLADQIVDIWTNYFKKIHYSDNYEQAKLLLSTPGNFVIPEVYIIEAQNVLLGMASAGIVVSAVDEWDVLLMSSFLDIDGLLASSGKENADKGPGCSTLISWGHATSGTGLNGKSVATRHTDWGAYDGIIGNDVIVIHLPSEIDEQPWVNVSYAGMIAPLSAMNQGGLAVFLQSMNQTGVGNISQTNNLPSDIGYGTIGQSYEPYWFTMRKAIEKADYNNDGSNNVLDIKDAVSSYTNGYAMPFIFTPVAKSTHGDPNLIAMIGEISPTAPITTFRSVDFDDQIPGDNIYSANEQIARNNNLNFCIRYNSVKDNIGNGVGFDAQSHWEFMSDYSNSKTLLSGIDNIQLMQYIPKDQILKYAGYSAPFFQAYLSPSLTLDLETVFSNNLLNTTDVEFKDSKLFPNPTDNYLNIEAEYIERIRIINMNGQIVNSYSFDRSNYAKLDILYLQSGIYILDIITANNSTQKLFIKD